MAEAVLLGRCWRNRYVHVNFDVVLLHILLGKSFVYNSLIGWCISKGYRVKATASTGIAATVLIGGKTIHSTFWIPIEVDDDTPPKINAHADYATPIRESELVVIDEISMLHRNVLSYLDRMLRDVCSSTEAFGGKVIVIGNKRPLNNVNETDKY